MVIKGIEENGDLRATRLGGLYPAKLGEGPVDILGSAEVAKGVLSFGSMHRTDANQHEFSWESARVITGLSPRESTCREEFVLPEVVKEELQWPDVDLALATWSRFSANDDEAIDDALFSKRPQTPQVLLLDPPGRFGFNSDTFIKDEIRLISRARSPVVKWCTRGSIVDPGLQLEKHVLLIELPKICGGLGDPR